MSSSAFFDHTTAPRILIHQRGFKEINRQYIDPQCCHKGREYLHERLGVELRSWLQEHVVQRPDKYAGGCISHLELAATLTDKALNVFEHLLGKLFAKSERGSSFPMAELACAPGTASW
jgi:hypothetical protein